MVQRIFSSSYRWKRFNYESRVLTDLGGPLVAILIPEIVHRALGTWFTGHVHWLLRATLFPS